jgi:hypothetical protein
MERGAYDEASGLIQALLEMRGIELQYVEDGRMMDERGVIGKRSLTDTAVYFCDRNGSRLIVRYCDDKATLESWFEVEIGGIRYDANSVSEHGLCVSFHKESFFREECWWNLSLQGKGRALLREIDPEFASAFEHGNAPPDTANAPHMGLVVRIINHFSSTSNEAVAATA